MKKKERRKNSDKWEESRYQKGTQMDKEKEFRNENSYDDDDGLNRELNRRYHCIRADTR